MHAPSVKPVPEPATSMFARPGSKEEPRRDLEAPRAPVFETALCKPRLQNGVKQGKDREGAIRRWLCVLAHSLEASETGKLLQASSGDGADVLSQVLAGKATSTLIKRARTCGNLVKFACDRGGKFFPVRLDMFKTYLDELISAGRQSAVRDTLEAVNFAKHVLGVSVDPGLLDHVWVKGVARASRIQTKETKRSRVLTIGEVLCMENALIEGRLDKVDRYAIGVFLFQVYSRSRVSDIRNIHRVIPDVCSGRGFIESQTYEHKGRRIANRANQVLILVAPIKGLAEKPWGVAWLDAARAVGLNFEAGFRGPLLPRLTVDYSWSGDAIGAGETSSWLTSLLSLLQGPVAGGLTSHGLKATTLSWMSKAGYSEESRLVLGHHSLGSKKRTLECYSREIQAAPLRELEECLSAIRTGNFLPDMTRSGMMAAPGQAVAPSPATHPRPLPETAEQTWLSRRAQSRKLALEVHSWASSVAETDSSGEVRLDSENPHLPSKPADKAVDSHHFPDPVKGEESQESTSSSESDSSGESDEKLDYGSLVEKGSAALDSVVPFANMGVDLDVFQNPRTKSLHARAKGSDGRSLCGRSVEGLKDFHSRVFSKHWQCKQCVAAKPIRDIGGAVAFLDKALADG